MRSSMKMALCGLAMLADSAFGQGASVSPVGEVIPYAAGIDAVDNPGGEAVVYADTVHVPEAAWLRLYFEGVVMPAGSRVRVTSLLDGEVQELDGAGLAMLGNSTAYFNGDTVSVEVIAGAGTVGTGLRVKRVALQRGVTPVGDPGQCGICGPDDRVLRNDLWMGRIVPTGGTGVVYCPTGTTMITAGSAISPRTGLVVQFNVPPSNGNCTIVHPPVLDQFPIDAASVNFRDAAPGDNWGVFRTGNNGIGQSPVLRYGQYRPLADAQEPPNTTATLSGYGLNTTCTSSQVQQVSQGQVLAVNANYVSVSCDARGVPGNWVPRGSAAGGVQRRRVRRAVRGSTSGDVWGVADDPGRRAWRSAGVRRAERGDRAGVCVERG